MKQAGQLSRTHEDSASREVVPDIYRKAMVDVLQSVPISVEQIKSKSRHFSRHTATPALSTSPVAADGSLAESPDGVQAASQVPTDGALVPPGGLTPAPVKEARHRSSKSSKAKSPATEIEKSTVTPGEDRATMEAKARAIKALVTTPGFASREDAVSWLRGTLNADPALENLVSNYEQAVNAQLVSDADKLIDHAASLKHDLAGAELQFISEKWPGWKPTGDELPGFLLALALLSLGAPVCYNLLKTVASLRPLSSTGVSITQPDRRIRREDRRYPQPREYVRPPAKAQARVREKTDDEREPAVPIQQS
jgi:hypothetical protein